MDDCPATYSRTFTVAPGVAQFTVRVYSFTTAATVRLHLAVNPPSLVLTPMTAEPAATAFTVPFWLTVATLLFDDSHVTDRSVALSGATVATNVSDSPTARDSTDLLRLTPVTLTEAIL